jgi:hypothetical protein
MVQLEGVAHAHCRCFVRPDERRVSLAVVDLPRDSAATTVAFTDASQFLTGFAGNTRSYR